MRRMGGLRTKIPVTFWVVTAATFAIAGFPPLAGFVSKDQILGETFASPHGGKLLWAIGVLTAGLTSFYMFRLWFMTFFGEYKPDADLGDAHLSQAAPAAHGSATHDDGHAADDHGHGHGGVHESPWIMLAPLVILAVLSVGGGLVGWPEFLGGSNRFEHFLAPVMESPNVPVAGPVMESSAATGERPATVAALETAEVPEKKSAPSASEELALASISVLAASLGLFFAWLLYYKQRDLPDRITSKIHGIYLTVLHKYYVDEGYGLLIVKPLLALSTVVFWRGVDQGVIDGMVNGAGTTSKGIGNQLRRMQSGNIRSYAAWVAVGGAAVIAYMVWWGVRK
jgi:NADH-quinone oxidoreductase subunit L